MLATNTNKPSTSSSNNTLRPGLPGTKSKITNVVASGATPANTASTARKTSTIGTPKDASTKVTPIVKTHTPTTSHAKTSSLSTKSSDPSKMSKISASIKTPLKAQVVKPGASEGKVAHAGEGIVKSKQPVSSTPKQSGERKSAATLPSSIPKSGISSTTSKPSPSSTFKPLISRTQSSSSIKSGSTVKSEVTPQKTSAGSRTPSVMSTPRSALSSSKQSPSVSRTSSRMSGVTKPSGLAGGLATMDRSKSSLSTMSSLVDVFDGEDMAVDSAAIKEKESMKAQKNTTAQAVLNHNIIDRIHNLHGPCYREEHSRIHGYTSQRSIAAEYSERMQKLKDRIKASGQARIARIRDIISKIETNEMNN
ncbi:hypothetical protein HDU76_003386 [Blyttiomyces sp. JEL0837]|nr:hypothetical protein HDU76_003386 [Blyttiomyces sp. JEL0837]